MSFQLSSLLFKRKPRTAAVSVNLAENPETLAEVIQNPLINSLKSDIARVEAKLKESSINLGRNHPQTVRTQAELGSLRKQLASETRHIHSSIGTSFEVGKHKETDLLAAMEKQKEKVLELNKQRDLVNVLKRDVEAAQRNFEGVSHRSAQTRLESVSVQTNIATLNPASIPTDPSRPKILLYLLASIFFGTVLGVAVAFGLELRSRRVRSVEDLMEAVQVPVFEIIPAAESLPPLRKPAHKFLRSKAPRRVLGAGTS